MTNMTLSNTMRLAVSTISFYLLVDLVPLVVRSQLLNDHGLYMYVCVHGICISSKIPKLALAVD